LGAGKIQKEKKRKKEKTSQKGDYKTALSGSAISRRRYRRRRGSEKEGGKNMKEK